MNEDRRACIIDFSIKDNSNGHKIGNALINELEKEYLIWGLTLYIHGILI